MEKKRIALITNNAGYTPQSSLGIYTWILAKELAKRNFEVLYYCKGNFIEDSVCPDNIRVVIFPQKSFWQDVIKDIKKEKIGVVLFQYVATIWGWNAIPFKAPFYISQLKLSGVQVITTFHETWIRWHFIKPWLFVQSVMQRIGAAVLVKSSDDVITSIDRYVKQLKIINASTHKIPIATNILPPPEKPDEVFFLKNLRSIYVSEDEILLVSFGNRDYSFLMEDIYELLKLNYKIKIVIVGNVSDVNKQKSNALIEKYDLKDAVTFTGIMNQDAIYYHLAMGDIIVCYETVVKGNEGGDGGSGRR